MDLKIQNETLKIVIKMTQKTTTVLENQLMTKKNLKSLDLIVYLT